MPKSLYAKLSLVLLALFIAIGAVFIILNVSFTDKYQQEINQKLNRELARLIVSENTIFKDDQINNDAMKEIFHMLMVINPSIEVYLLDPQGTIMAFSADPGKVKRKKVDVGPLKDLLRGNPSLPLLGDDPRAEQGKKVFTAAPIPEKGVLKGYLYVILGGETYDSVIQKINGSYILRLGLWVISISLLIAFISGLLIFAFLTRKLKRLSTAMDGYESGMPLDTLDLPAGGDGHSGDEIDRLASTFAEMAGRINQQVKRLEESDTLRRELVANVSHDLRTPLATLRGYMETLLMKNSGLSEAERKDYLTIAISHCDRLSSLIADLFELAKLDSPESTISPEPFNPGELAQDVVQKFSLSAREKHITITADMERDLPFVRADIALMERVLENLIENAIRFTPEKGTIRVSLTHEHEEVIVEVSDTGPGIPEEDIPRIFDRFYQLERSRKGKQGHSGLGLAIANRICALHGTSIRVKSVLDSGTSFKFSLPVYRHV